MIKKVGLGEKKNNNFIKSDENLEVVTLNFENNSKLIKFLSSDQKLFIKKGATHLSPPDNNVYELHIS